MDEEARCLKDAGANASRCSIDGNYICSITETGGDGVDVQTCYDTTTGEVLGTDRLTDAGTKIDCRENYEYATCTSPSDRQVSTGDLVEMPDDRCNYCLCTDGVINNTQCEKKMGCIDVPTDCTFNGITVAHGETVTAPNGCVQKRCENGFLSDSSLDANYDVCRSGRPSVSVRKL
ncbi:hypothetical protein LOD99_12734 [Oopsacas minuta]|uniref:VWFD domain-containing protein n=1 Tax=Oopsacas minuta TaxID=111878 RepID=A0AAV7JD56_9METZ|nr:hypothetical protein LOD99_12734 [Oopsacas minuta]